MNGFSAIHLYLRYRELVSHNRVVAVVIYLNMGVKCVHCFLNVLSSTRYFLTSYIIYRDYRCHSYNYGLCQDLFSCTTTQESVSGSASTTRGTAAGWRSDNFFMT